MLPTPEAGLRSIGSTIRAARLARGLTQQKAAKDAKVSRAQLALLERGGNVTVKFLLKITRFLGLSDVPLDGTVRLTSGRDGLNVAGLIEALDLVAALVEHLRSTTMNALLPPSERGTLTDTLALREFIAKHLADDIGVQRLAKAVAQLSEDVPSIARPPHIEDEPQQHQSSRGSRRARRRLE